MSTATSLPVVTIIGSGYTGVTGAAILASIGYTVYALEINPTRLAAIREGKAFFYEEHLDALLKSAVEAGRLLPTDSYADAIPNSDIVFSCVGTPDNADGSTNLDYVLTAATTTARHAKPGLVYAQRSTVPVGTGQKIEQIFADAGAAIAYVSNPEFLREGTALIDSLWFSRAVVGGSDSDACDKVLAIHRKILSDRDTVAKQFGISAAAITDPSFITTSLNSSELIKVSANAFLSLKISFANSIAKLADATGSDIVEVMNGIGSDKRIGRDFLNAGRGYGGGCFPKDVSGLISSGLEFGVDLAIMQAVSAENDSMPGYIVEKALRESGDESFDGKKVALLGLSFKAGTSDTRKSPAIKIARLLVEKAQANITAYDPQAEIHDGDEPLHESIVRSDSLSEAISDADIVVVATDWPEFKNEPKTVYGSLKKNTLIVDAMNCLDKTIIEDLGFRYVGVGR